MSDLVKLLRAGFEIVENELDTREEAADGRSLKTVLNEAADRIEALEAENERLTAELTDFQQAWDDYMKAGPRPRRPPPPLAHGERK